MARQLRSAMHAILQCVRFLGMVFTGLFILGCLFIASVTITAVFFDPLNALFVVFFLPITFPAFLFAYYLYCSVFCNLCCSLFCKEPIERFKLTRLKRFKGRLLWGIVLFSCILICMVKPQVDVILPLSLEHVSYEQIPHTAVPKGGTDYSWYRGPRSTRYCECTITEKSFEDWLVSDSRWERRIAISEESPYYVWGFGKVDNFYVTDGIAAEYGDNIGGVVVFDRKTNRAYYWTYY